MDVRWDPPPSAAARTWGPVGVGIPVGRVGRAGWEWVDARPAHGDSSARREPSEVRPNDLAKTLRVTLGREVRQLRKRLGHSQETFAVTCGVHRTFVGAVERGEVNLTLASLQRLARGLGVDVARLFGEPVASDPCRGSPNEKSQSGESPVIRAGKSLNDQV